MNEATKFTKSSSIRATQGLRPPEVLEKTAYAPGELIVQHGAHGTAMYVLISGEASRGERGGCASDFSKTMIVFHNF